MTFRRQSKQRERMYALAESLKAEQPEYWEELEEIVLGIRPRKEARDLDATDFLARNLLVGNSLRRTVEGTRWWLEHFRDCRKRQVGEVRDLLREKGRPVRLEELFERRITYPELMRDVIDDLCATGEYATTSEGRLLVPLCSLDGGND